MRQFLPNPGGESDSGSEDEDFVALEEGGLVVEISPPSGVPDDSGPSGSDANNDDASSSMNISTNDKDAEPEGNWYFSDSDDEEQHATKEEVFEIEPALEATRDQPPDIEVGAEVIDVKFHPSKELIAVATLDAEVVMYKYSISETQEVHSSEHHESALRAIIFSKDGNTLYSGSKDKSVALLDTNTFQIKRHYLKAHDYPVYSLCAINHNLFASGDDEGILKVWDLRKSLPIFKFRCGEDTVNSIIVDDNEKTLVAAVNDGSIAAFNIHKRKLIVQSELYTSSLNCMAVVRNGTRLAVGSDSGDLCIFNWGEFGLHTDNVSEQPQQINCMEAIGDNRVITGCEDGYIRAINLYPHRYVGVVGRHMKYGVEGISISCDQKYLASCCQTDTVQFWDLEHVYTQETDEKKKSVKHMDMTKNLSSARERNVNEFFTDMSADIPSDDEYVGPVEKQTNIED